MRIDLLFFLLLIVAAVAHIIFPDGFTFPDTVGYEDSWQSHIERQQYRQVP